ncbi:3,4-dihydroxy-2-butanone-4-phosphate synthase [Bacillus canaveralius]|nr:3,4-dihydroxy-2-butanone-4-phosphate synthase [Bacillus canaveralius]
MFDRIEDALEDLRQGRIVIVCDNEDRENEGDFVCLAELSSPEVINFMAKEGRGLICVPITKKLAEKLRLDPMIENNTDSHGTAFTVSIDHVETTTGISAFERSLTIRKMLDKKATGGDFKRPGHVFPLIANNGGVVERAGHTEAAVDLARLCGSPPAGVICEIMNEDGTMARVPDLKKLANKFDMRMITIADLIQYRLKHDSLVQKR